MKPATGPPGEQRVRLGAVDRYLVPVAERPVLDYFMKRLFVAHGLRERMLRSVLVSPLRSGARRLLIDGTWHASSNPYRLHPGATAASGEQAERWRGAAGLIRELEATPDALEAAGLRLLAPGRSIILRDYDTAGRGRVLVFAFRPGATEPSAVVKLRHPVASGAGLRREHDALQRVRACRSLARSVPEPLLHRRTANAEILVLSSVPGTSAYVDMQTSLRPSRRVGTHFAAAAEWLARFHREMTQAHGDYWARNILLRPRSGGGTEVAVVDWEHASASGDPLRDLFHFPVTYGLNYPWRRYRRSRAGEAIRRTFLEEGGVAGHVAAYFRLYCDMTGLERDRLRPGLEAYLEARAEAAPPTEAEEWRACANTLAASPRTVLDP